MKGFVVAVIAAFLSLFGIHQAPTHIASTPQSAQVASAVSAAHPRRTFQHRARTPESAPADSTSSTNSGQASSPQATIINGSTPLTGKQYITQPVIGRSVQSAPFTTGRVLGASTDAPDAKLSDLQDQIDALKTQVFGTVSTSSVNYGLPSSGGYLNNVALSQEIDQLPSTVTVGGAPVVTSNTLTNTVSNYLPLTGGTV